MANSPLSRRFFAASAGLLVTAALLAAPSATLAAETPASPQARATLPIDETSLVTLKGNTNPHAQTRYDTGPAPASMPASRLLLVLRRGAQQEAALQTYLESVQNPSSPNYRKWLTPDEFGTRFGVAETDLATVQSWLRAHGFTVSKVAKGRMAIEFSGTAGQIQEAFHTSIHGYLVDGVRHWANSSDPRIPAALAPVVAGLAELSSFVPKAHVVRGPSGRYNPATGRIEPTYTIGDTNNGYYIFLGPADAATIYDTPTSLNASPPSSLLDGSGVTIGIAGDSNIDTTQNANYRATFGLPAKATTVIVDGSDPGENGDAVEAYLDTEVAGGIAPNASVILYTAANTELDAGLFLAIGRALDDNQVDILNVSFGGCEAAQGASGNQFIYDLWEQAAAQGISVTVSTGDSGSAGCDDPNTEQYAGNGLAVNGLASTPYNIAVGGTDFDVLYSNFPSSFTQYVDISNTFAHHRSAIGYIPEEPWNDSTLYGMNAALNENVDSPNPNIVGAGGGVSSCTTLSGTICASGYPTPIWQSGFATDKSGRNLPDVSLVSANGYYGALWGLCTDQDYQSGGILLQDCANNPTTGNNFNLTGVGGTSASAPAFAGILALVKQKAGARLGQADYVLYDLAKSSYSTVFHDISTGNNSVACNSGSPNCAQDLAGYDFLTGYDTGVGYDEASGLGSVDAAQLVANWASAGLTATTASLTLNGGVSALNITHGASVKVAAGVTASGGTPTGDVALVDSIDPASFPNNDSLGFFTLAGGDATGTTTYLPGGSYSVSAHYGGSSSFAASDSNAIPVTVAPETSSTVLQVSAIYDPITAQQTNTASYGFVYEIDAQPYGNSSSASAPNGAATGSIAFASGGTKLGSAVIGSDGIAELQTFLLPTGNDSLTASFPGDPSFLASTSAPVAFSVTPAITSLGAPSPSGSSFTAGSAITLQAGLGQLDSFGVAPTGKVTFFNETPSGTTTLGTATLQGSAGSLGVFAGGSASLTTTLLPAGLDTLTATYSGDANYEASPLSPPSTIVISTVRPTVTVKPSATIIKVDDPLQILVSVATASGLPAPTGTIVISTPGSNASAGYTSPATTLINGSATVTVPPNSLPIGSNTLSAQYNGDSYYSANVGVTVVLVKSTGTLPPTVTVTPSANPIRAFPAQVAVTVSGTGAVPTGTVQLITPNFAFAPTALTNGSATFTLTQGNLPVGASSLPVTYSGDDNYLSGSGTAQVVVAGIAAITVTPASPSVQVAQTLSVAVSLQQYGTLPVPTGTVTLTSGSFSVSATIASGKATILIPANSLALGVDALAVKYSGDGDYNPSSGSASVTVYAQPPTFALTNSGGISLSPGASTGNSATITVTPAYGFTGSVALTAEVTSSPAGAVDPPTLSLTGTPVVIAGSGSGKATLVVATTAPATAANPQHASSSHAGPVGARWFSAGAVALAGVLLLGVPARRRAWRAFIGMLSAFALVVFLAGSMAACGGGGGNSGGGGGNAGTTAGTYTVTVTGTEGNLTQTTSVTVTVN